MTLLVHMGPDDYSNQFSPQWGFFSTVKLLCMYDAYSVLNGFTTALLIGIIGFQNKGIVCSLYIGNGLCPGEGEQTFFFVIVITFIKDVSNYNCNQGHK